MELNKTHIGDCMELSKQLPDDYVDLVVTSPPYADTVSYGSEVNVFSPENYPNWILPLFDEASRFLKPTGSFILNINDRIVNGERSIYVMETIVNIVKNTDLKLFERYIWAKKNGLPTGGDKRLNDRVEYLFHFVRDTKEFKCNMDTVRIPYAKSSIARYKSPNRGQKVADENGITSFKESKMLDMNPLGGKPPTVFNFDNAGVLKGSKHPAPFHPQLPEFFIKWLTDKGDVVLDPFMGGGTTAQVALEMNRNYIGFEINDTYLEELIIPNTEKFSNDFWE